MLLYLEPTDLCQKLQFETIDGVQYERGLKNIHFVTNKESKTAELDKPLVLIVESEVENVRKIQSVLEYAIKQNRSLLIIADVDQQGYVCFSYEQIKRQYKSKLNWMHLCMVVNKKETLDDLALLTGATIINEDLGDDIDLIGPEHLGEIQKSVTNQVETILHVGEVCDELKVKLIKD